MYCYFYIQNILLNSNKLFTAKKQIFKNYNLNLYFLKKNKINSYINTNFFNNSYFFKLSSFYIFKLYFKHFISLKYILNNLFKFDKVLNILSLNINNISYTYFDLNRFISFEIINYIFFILNKLNMPISNIKFKK